MKKPIISVIVPVYNAEPFLSRCVDSLLSQTLQDIEVVLVDDGSTDSSKALCEQYATNDARVKVVSQPNRGVAMARQTGIDAACGVYSIHVDPDDWLSEGSLEAIASRAKETDADIIYFNYVKEYADRSSVKKEKLYTSDQRGKYIRNMYNHKAFGTLCNKCVKRSVYTENQLHHPKYGYAEDCFLSVQLVGYAKTLAYLDMDIYHYRKTNPTSITRQGLKRRKGEYIANFLDLYEKYQDGSHLLNVIFDDVFLQAGWYSMLYGLDLYSSRPYLLEKVRSAKIRGNANVWVPLQLLVKLCSYFRSSSHS